MNTIILVLSVYTACLTVLMMYLLGSRKRVGFLVSMLNQANWVALNILTGAYGLLLLTPVLTWLAIRGWCKWSPQEDGNVQ